MPRVTTLAPRIACAPSRLKPSTPVVPTYGQGRGGRPWRRKRDAVLLRDKYLCQCEGCQAGGRLPLLADEVDHIVPVAEGGTDELSNLRAINRDCHKVKTQEEARRGAARR
ncbi:HNH endonuclease signature motif containing protein [Stenotrophomonas sp. SORGH_AS_0321]|uniref:HNH endonuclease n=1 Tax=Stenotrophomonas sp. SORGH_AS_0321 TaxID=3041787 RepID=UPI002861753A|nr:HNH endonuclease signature motif containing protein [Stenotrophomonas sp. SORGH_AS_0321]MDR6094906.1 5-methylcytosine-specific restriction protein A [Stenotrophomonas sp. SORGH_AS_0321]